MEQTGTQEAVKVITDTTEQPGTNWAEPVRNLIDWADAWPIIVELLDANTKEWSFYARRRDMIDLLQTQHLYCAPSISKCEAACLFSVEEYKTGNVEINVLWSGSKVGHCHVPAFVEAAQLLAGKYNATRINMKSCRVMVKSLKNQGFTPRDITMIKDL